MKHNVYVNITVQVPGQSGGLGLYTIVPNARKKFFFINSNSTLMVFTVMMKLQFRGYIR